MTRLHAYLTLVFGLTLSLTLMSAPPASTALTSGLEPEAIANDTPHPVLPIAVMSELTQTIAFRAPATSY